MSKILYIVRGAPGAGKSTFVKCALIPFIERTRYIPEKYITHIESDKYFYNENDEYVFDPSKLAINHAKCHIEAADALLGGSPDHVAIVSNTSIHMSEMEPYLTIAKQAGAEVVVIRMSTQFESVHNVPEERVTYMREHMDDYDGEIMSEDFIKDNEIEF